MNAGKCSSSQTPGKLACPRDLMNDLFASLSTKETLDFYQFSIKRSHSIHMLSIQIGTKSFELVQQHQIVLLCKPYETKFFLFWMLHGYSILYSTIMNRFLILTDLITNRPDMTTFSFSGYSVSAVCCCEKYHSSEFQTGNHLKSASSVCRHSSFWVSIIIGSLGIPAKSQKRQSHELVL